MCKWISVQLQLLWTPALYHQPKEVHLCPRHCTLTGLQPCYTQINPQSMTICMFMEIVMVAPSLGRKIQMKGGGKKNAFINFLIWDIWVDAKTSTTGLALKTAVANSAIWPLTWVFWSLNGGLWIPTPVRTFTSLRSPAAASLDPSITLAQCMHRGILGRE